MLERALAGQLTNRRRRQRAAARRSTAPRCSQPAPALVLAATGLQDPGNAGAIIRSAAAAGATGVVLDESSADPWGWKALRASMGSAFHLPVLRSRGIGSLIEEWRAAGLRIAATVPRGGTPMHDVDFTPPMALLLGGEGAGLPDELRRRRRRARQHSRCAAASSR